MRREDQCRLAILAQPNEAIDRFWRELDLIHFPGTGVDDVPQPVKMHELRADTAKIVPDASEYTLDLTRRPSWESGFQISAAYAVFRQPGTDAPQNPTGFSLAQVGLVRRKT